MDAIIENRLLSRWKAFLPRAPGQIGAIHEADAELLPLGDGRVLALTVDTVYEEVAVGLYRDPATAGRIAATAALSDLAAVGADPLGLLLSVVLPEADAEAAQQAVGRAVAGVCAVAGTSVLGGDTACGDFLMVTCTAAGVVSSGQPLLRIGASPGEAVFAGGRLGAGAALAAAVLLDLPEAFAERDYRPPVRVAQGRALRGIASACIDTSDGSIAALDQLARLNRMAIRIQPPLERLLHPAAAAIRERLGLRAFPFLAAHHGEFELIFTVPRARVPELLAVAAETGWEPLELGTTEPGAGLFAGERPINGAAVRNLFHESGGDLRAYIRALCEVRI